MGAAVEATEPEALVTAGAAHGPDGPAAGTAHFFEPIPIFAVTCTVASYRL